MAKIVNGEIVRDADGGRSQPDGPNIGSVHRSIRIAHSIACVTLPIALLTFLVCSWYGWSLILLSLAVLLARLGGAWIHGLLPGCLQVRALVLDALL